MVVFDRDQGSASAPQPDCQQSIIVHAGCAMQKPVEITFHNIESSDAVETAIRGHVARLERIYGRMTTCRVRVDQSNQNANESMPPVVHIDILVPGHKDIVVAHTADHLQRKYQAPDLHNAINEAFRMAERRLSKYKDKLTDHGDTRSIAANERVPEK
jgi:ribosomal subunit interface protein